MANPNPSPETRFRGGCPPGPGRPRSKPITDRVRERLEQAADGGGDLDGRTVADELVDHWLDSVRAGDVTALRELLARVEGKLSDRVEHEGQVTIRVEYADAPSPDDHPAEAASEAGGDPGEPGEVPRTGVWP